MNEPLRVQHRGIWIQCEYSILSDLHAAEFMLPERASERNETPHTFSLPPGLHKVEDKKPDRAVELAMAAIDHYLDG